MGSGVAEGSCTCYSQSQFVYANHVLSLSLQGLYGPSSIFGFFWPDMNTEMGLVMYMYLKHSPDYIYSKYI